MSTMHKRFFVLPLMVVAAHGYRREFSIRQISSVAHMEFQKLLNFINDVPGPRSFDEVSKTIEGAGVGSRLDPSKQLTVLLLAFNSAVSIKSGRLGDGRRAGNPSPLHWQARVLDRKRCCGRSSPVILFDADGSADEQERFSNSTQLSETAGGAVFLLLGLATINQFARALIFYTVDFKTQASDEAVRLFMNLDVGFDEAQYGLLASIGFAFLFSLTSLAAGGLTDRVDARNLLTGTSVVWSGATILQGLARSFSDVLGGRALLGVSQAFTNPASFTILGRVYPKEQSASVNGLYSASVYLGGGLAALSVLANAQVGWRMLHVLVGAAGILTCGVVQATLPPLPPQDSAGTDAEDTRKDESARDSVNVEGDISSSVSALGELVSDPVVRLLLAASTLRFLAGFTIGVWVVPFFRETWPQSIGAEFAFLKAAVNGIAGSISATGGGVLADQLGAQEKRFQLWVPAAGSLLAIPCWLATLNAPSLEFSLGALFLEYTFAECWFGPTVARLQAAAPPSAQGLTAGVFSCLTLIGNLAPFFVGLAVQSGSSDLTSILSYSVPVLYTGSALTFIAAGQAIEKKSESGR